MVIQTQTIVNTECLPDQWKIVEAIPEPIASGWYKISMNATSAPYSGFFLAAVDPSNVAGINNTWVGPNNNPNFPTGISLPADDVFYYDQNNTALYSVVYKGGVNNSPVCSASNALSLVSNQYNQKSGYVVISDTTKPVPLFFSNCSNNPFAVPNTQFNDNMYQIVLNDNLSMLWNVTPAPAPTFQSTGNLKGFNIVKLTTIDNKVVWYDPEQAIQLAKDSEEKFWYVTDIDTDGNSNIFTIINDEQYYWTKLLQTPSNGLANDFALTSVALTKDLTQAGKWKIPQLDGQNSSWLYRAPNLLPFSAKLFTTFLYNTDTNQYLIFDFHTGNPLSALFPSSSSVYELLYTVNVQVITIAPTSVPTGMYYLETSDGQKCLSSDGTFISAPCGLENAWKYNAETNVVQSVQGTSCLTTELDENCEGDPSLVIGDCTNPKHFVLGVSGEVYNTDCDVCYEPNTTGFAVNRNYGQSKKFKGREGYAPLSALTNTKHKMSSGMIIVIVLILVLIIGAVMFFTMKK